MGGLLLVVLVLGACGRWCSGWAEDDRSDFDRRWDETVDDLIVLGPFDD